MSSCLTLRPCADGHSLKVHTKDLTNLMCPFNFLPPLVVLFNSRLHGFVLFFFFFFFFSFLACWFLDEMFKRKKIHVLFITCSRIFSFVCFHIFHALLLLGQRLISFRFPVLISISAFLVFTVGLTVH